MKLKKKVILNLILILLILFAILMTLGVNGNLDDIIGKIQQIGMKASKAEYVGDYTYVRL